MANREALRDLQSRLAQRLSAVRTEAPGSSWLAIECAGVGLLVPLAGAGEIFPLGTIASVPHTRPWFAGVANLRGGLHGVVDLAAFLGLRPTQAAAEGVREQARLLALNPVIGSHVALLFERLAGLRTAAQLQREDDDEVSRPSFATGRWRDDRQRVWQEIDPAALVQHEQFLGIAR
ncbi:chemotaxis protein CheW [Rubrivivax gelatinosus]|uniref:chemotaxis protein CheW n=1 Tax=Rubrivivax gelatinosus TaxID=28068 RepID=UPI0019057FA6|nr:chemotaxis protein CheW [Rubrivivax gelatinosus]MBK1613157.1 chemotaxis protein CheW [Rubrivivax gelatinosus]